MWSSSKDKGHNMPPVPLLAFLALFIPAGPAIGLLYLTLTEKHGVKKLILSLVLGSIAMTMVLAIIATVYMLMFADGHATEMQQYYMTACGCSEQCKATSQGAQRFCP